MNHEWRNRALCAEIGWAIFFPSENTSENNSHRYDDARAACGMCPVWRECLIDDLDTSEFSVIESIRIIPDGMRGGLSPRERSVLVHRARKLSNETNNDNENTRTHKTRHDQMLKVASELINQYSQKELQEFTHNDSVARANLFLSAKQSHNTRTA